MGLYNFKKQFVPMILSGEKTHTIRAKRKHPDKPGNTLYLYTGLRTKGSRFLAEAKCSRVEEITIDVHGCIAIDGATLYASEAEQLARRDGFVSHAEMLRFWDGRLPFAGDIIHWKPCGDVDSAGGGR